MVLEKENVFKRLTNIFRRTKFTHQEINPEKMENQALPSETDEKRNTSSFPSNVFNNITEIRTKTRQLENDRFLRYRDYEEMCLVGDTKIALLNGKSIKIKDWVEKKELTDFFVYSYDLRTNKIVGGIGSNARLLRKDEPIVEIYLSNGKKEKMTLDHLILLDNNKYVEAKDLKVGDKIKTLQRRTSEKKDGLIGYEMFRENGKWIFTHRRIAETSYGNTKGKDVHHINENKKNNIPLNLKVLTKKEHIKEHEKRNFIEKTNLKFSFWKNIQKQKKDKYLTQTYYNTKEVLEVKKVVFPKKRYDVYDIEVYKYHNFALDSGIFVHNCSDALIDSGVQTYADESVQKNEREELFTITAEDKRIEKMLKELFYDKIKITNYLWSIAYDLAKYGDVFYEIVFNKNSNDILYLKYISPYKIFRVEKEGKLIGFKYVPHLDNLYGKREVEILSLINDDKETRLIDPYKIVHFKIKNTKFGAYGKSILEAARTTWKQLQLLEDGVIIYRLVRAPERRVWYIDTGNLSPDRAVAYVNKIKGNMRKKSIIDPLTGKATNEKKAISYIEDFWIPVRQGSTGNKVEVLQSQQKLGEIDDLKYFRDKIMSYLRIQKAFYAEGGEGGGQMSGKSLAALDVFFGRAVERLQRFIEEGLYKIAYIYLILKKTPVDKIKSIKINLTSPSIYMEASRIEVLKNKFSLLGDIKNTGIFPDVWILKEILNVDDEELLYIVSLMQAQQSGQDIVAILTGQTGQEQGQQSGEEGINQSMEREIEKGIGANPEGSEEGGGEEIPVENPEGSEEGGEEEIPVTSGKEIETKKTTPSEMIKDVLSNLSNESVKLNDKTRKFLLEKLIENNNAIKTLEKKILQKKNTKSNITEGGFENFFSTGEFSGLKTKLIKEIREKKNILLEKEKKNFEKNNKEKMLTEKQKQELISKYKKKIIKKMKFYEEHENS